MTFPSMTRAALMLALSLGASGCVNQAPETEQAAPAPPPPVAGPKKLALLVPLSGPNARLGEALRRAASLALSAPDAPKLDVHDTSGDAGRAGEEARNAVAAGDSMILGPLTAAETTAVAGVAGSVPVLAFTSDPSVSTQGVWTLGLTPTQQMQRLVQALRDEKRARVAALLPPGAFGDALAQGLTESMADAGLAPPTIHRTVSTDQAEFDSALQDLANVTERHQAVNERIAALKQGDAGSADLAAQPTESVPFDALLLAQAGPTLEPTLRHLPEADITLPGVRLVGPALWAGQATSHPRLAGAWYAAPDPEPHQLFARAYAAKFGAPPPALASLAFDAAAIGASLAKEGDITMQALTRSEGFAGADGLVQLQADGHVKRALAVFESAPGGDKIVSPAPDSIN